MKTTGDQQLVKRINRSVLLRLARAQPGASRAQLASLSGLTKSTVSLLVREMIDEGWLAESAAVSTPVPGAGRPSTPVQINATARYLLGIEIAIQCVRVVGVSLQGDVLASHEVPLESHVPLQVCAVAARLAAKLHADCSQRGILLSGMGVGLPGAFDEATGVVRFAPNLGWRDVAFAPLIARALQSAGLPNVPLHIQNEADTAALSEYEFGPDAGEDALIFVTCDVGVGAGIVLNDRLFTGAHGMAGEIGHCILQVDGPLCSCGRKGCAETFFGARALAQKANHGDQLQLAGQYLGVLIQNLWTNFDPGLMVLGGASCVQHPELVNMARSALQSYAASAGVAPPKLRGARYGLLASAVGAAALVLHQFLRPMHATSERATASARQPLPSVQGLRRALALSAAVA